MAQKFTMAFFGERDFDEDFTGSGGGGGSLNSVVIIIIVFFCS